MSNDSNAENRSNTNRMSFHVGTVHHTTKQIIKIKRRKRKKIKTEKRIKFMSAQHCPLFVFENC